MKFLHKFVEHGENWHKAKPEKGGGGGTTIQKSDPWKGSQPFLKDYMARAQELSNVPRDFFPGQTYAGFTPQIESGLQRMSSGVGLDPSRDYYSGLLSGTGTEAITAPVAEQIASKWAAGGRYGSPGMGQDIARGVTQAIAPYQMQAAAALPQLEAMQTQGQLQAGEAYRGLDQAAIDEAMQRFQFEQNEPRQRLQEYAALVSPGAGFGGQTAASQSMPGGSRLSGAIGGGLMGSALGSSSLVTGFSPLAFLGGPVAPLLGAGLGLAGIL